MVIDQKLHDSAIRCSKIGVWKKSIHISGYVNILYLRNLKKNQPYNDERKVFFGLSQIFLQPRDLALSTPGCLTDSFDFST